MAACSFASRSAAIGPVYQYQHLTLVPSVEKLPASSSNAYSENCIHACLIIDSIYRYYPSRLLGPMEANTANTAKRKCLPPLVYTVASYSLHVGPLPQGSASYVWTAHPVPWEHAQSRQICYIGEEIGVSTKNFNKQFRSIDEEFIHVCYSTAQRRLRTSRSNSQRAIILGAFSISSRPERIRKVDKQISRRNQEDSASHTMS